MISNQTLYYIQMMINMFNNLNIDVHNSIRL